MIQHYVFHIGKLGDKYALGTVERSSSCEILSDLYLDTVVGLAHHLNVLKKQAENNGALCYYKHWDLKSDVKFFLQSHRSDIVPLEGDDLEKLLERLPKGTKFLDEEGSI